MPKLRHVLCRIDDSATDQLTELASFDLPAPDELEATVQVAGNAMLRRLLQAALEELDAEVAARYRQQKPAGSVRADGLSPLNVVSRFGAVSLRRQVLYHPAARTHVLPGNALLPEHEGVVTTRGLQEWACLLLQDLSFAAVARLLGWQAQETDVLSATTVRTLAGGSTVSSALPIRSRTQAKYLTFNPHPP